jgi:hypothetical protein
MAMLARKMQGKEQAIEGYLVGNGHGLGLLGNR